MGIVCGSFLDYWYVVGSSTGVLSSYLVCCSRGSKDEWFADTCT